MIPGPSILHKLAWEREWDKLRHELKEIRDYSAQLNSLDNGLTVLDIILTYEPDADLIVLLELLGAKTCLTSANFLIGPNDLSVEDTLKQIQQLIENKIPINELKIRMKNLKNTTVREIFIQKCKTSEVKKVIEMLNDKTEIICYLSESTTPNNYKIFVIYLDLCIGTGQWGSIYVTQEILPDYSDSEINVVKIMKMSKNQAVIEKIENEITITNSIGPGMGYIYSREFHYLFMKYGGIPLSALPKNTPLILKKKISVGILRAFYDIHFNNIYHRDIKPDNVLVLINYTGLISKKKASDTSRKSYSSTSPSSSSSPLMRSSDSELPIGRTLLHSELPVGRTSLRSELHSDVKVTVCDYGDSCYMRDQNQVFMGTPSYQPPEAHKSNEDRPIYSIQTEGIRYWNSTWKLHFPLVILMISN